MNFAPGGWNGLQQRLSFSNPDCLTGFECPHDSPQYRYGTGCTICGFMFEPRGSTALRYRYMPQTFQHL